MEMLLRKSKNDQMKARKTVAVKNQEPVNRLIGNTKALDNNFETLNKSLSNGPSSP